MTTIVLGVLCVLLLFSIPVTTIAAAIGFWLFGAIGAVILGAIGLIFESARG